MSGHIIQGNPSMLLVLQARGKQAWALGRTHSPCAPGCAARCCGRTTLTTDESTVTHCHSARTSGVSTGEGASSTSFWLRRWMLQSRSPRWITLPCLSQSTCRQGTLFSSRLLLICGKCKAVVCKQALQVNQVQIWLQPHNAILNEPARSLDRRSHA